MKGSWTSSIQTEPGRRRFAAALAALAVFCALASLCLGPVNLSPLDAVSALLGRGDGTLRQIVLLVRLPRTCGCLLAGAALAVAGAVIQGVMDNPLAAPNIIGVNSGAGLAVALCCALAPTAVVLVPFAAFLGALSGVLLVLFIAQKAGAAL